MVSVSPILNLRSRFHIACTAAVHLDLCAADAFFHITPGSLQFTTIVTFCGSKLQITAALAILLAFMASAYHAVLTSERAVLHASYSNRHLACYSASSCSNQIKWIFPLSISMTTFLKSICGNCSRLVPHDKSSSNKFRLVNWKYNPTFSEIQIQLSGPVTCQRRKRCRDKRNALYSIYPSFHLDIDGTKYNHEFITVNTTTIGCVNSSWWRQHILKKVQVVRHGQECEVICADI